MFGYVVMMLVGLSILNAAVRLFGDPREAGPWMLLLGGLAVLLTVGALFLRRIANPLGDIVQAAHRVARGDLSTRVTVDARSPMRPLAAAFNDMTERLETQEQQRRQLLAEIAHELRTPLSVIQGKLEGLIDGLYPRDDQALNALVDDTRMVARLVEDLRVLSQTESGALELHVEPTDIGAVLHDVVDTFAADALRRGVALRADIADLLPSVTVDPFRIRQVVANLAANALRYTPSGSVVVAAMSAETGVLIRVTDTGSGIPADELPRIFDRFYKGRESKGSGLGLTIARDLINAHHGRIAAESIVGQGTTISVWLPAMT